MAADFPKCGRHYLLEFHLPVTNLKRSYQKSPSPLKQSVHGHGCCPEFGCLRPNPVGKLHCATWCSPLWVQPQEEGEGQCCVNWGLEELSFCSISAPMAAGSGCTSHPSLWALQVTMTSHAPVKTVRSRRLWLWGFLLDAPLRRRHSDHFASF